MSLVESGDFTEALEGIPLRGLVLTDVQEEKAGDKCAF